MPRQVREIDHIYNLNVCKFCGKNRNVQQGEKVEENDEQTFHESSKRLMVFIFSFLKTFRMPSYKEKLGAEMNFKRAFTLAEEFNLSHYTSFRSIISNLGHASELYPLLSVLVNHPYNRLT